MEVRNRRSIYCGDKVGTVAKLSMNGKLIIIFSKAIQRGKYTVSSISPFI
jgi:hypothetical protein